MFTSMDVQADVNALLLPVALAALVAYLLGSVKTGIIISRIFYGKDIRKSGSGGAGMTNMLRTFGVKAALFTFLGDVAKGALAVLAGRLCMLILLPGTEGLFASETLYGAYVASVTVILGDAFPVYFKFKGGKGIATTVGAAFVLIPAVAGASLAIFIIVVALSRMVSLGSVIAAVAYGSLTFLWTFFLSGQMPLFASVCAGIATLLMLVMHRENIVRLLNGTEYKFGSSKNKT